MPKGKKRLTQREKAERAKMNSGFIPKTKAGLVQRSLWRTSIT